MTNQTSQKAERQEKENLIEEILEDIRIAKLLDTETDTTTLQSTVDKLTCELEVFEKFEAVADNHNIPTLDVRNSDSLDFHEVFVGDLLEMMEYAYELGRSHS